MRRIRARAVGGGRTFACPVCGGSSAFLEVRQRSGSRPWAECGRCGAYERHRLQAEVLRSEVIPQLGASARALQLAPDALTPWLRARVHHLVTADLFDRQAELRLDVRALDVEDASFDLVFASHVLEHVDEDRRAIAEIARVLKPGGLAVLPVPLLAPTTVEYGVANPHEEYHVRAPGLDYFDRYRSVFGEVRVITSADVRQDVQPWIYEDREGYPTSFAPLRPPVPGERHLDAVPICRK